jgi:hypothetical protein
MKITHIMNLLMKICLILAYNGIIFPLKSGVVIKKKLSSLFLVLDK